METLVVLLVLVVVLIIPNIKVVPQASSYVIERLGSYHETWKNGLHFKIPFIDRISNIINLKEIVLDFKPQSVITKDNVKVQIDTVVYLEISDPKLYTYKTTNPIAAVESLITTNLINLICNLELDQTLNSRDMMNLKIKDILNEVANPWGIKVNRVEIKNILPSRDIVESMEKQAHAERERRIKILQAEQEKMTSILLAEGKKESKIRIAEGEAQSIKLIKEAKADSAVITLKSLETLSNMANGKATKIIIPSELQNIANLTTTIREMIGNKKNEKQP